MFASRRTFIAGGAALGAAACAPRTPATEGGEHPRKIDLHHHIRPDALQNLPAILAEMDQNGIAMALGIAGAQAVPGVGEQARNQARRQNEGGAEVVAARPDRFGLMAVLPMEDIEGSLAEIAYAADVLKCDGFGMGTSYGDAWMGDRRFDPIWEELNRRNAAVFFHPFNAACCTEMTYLETPVIPPWLEWPTNTARMMTSFITNRTLTRYPNLKLIVAHGGGVMPIMVKRMAGFIALGDDFMGLPRGGPPPGRSMAELFPDGIEAEFAKFYFELAQAYEPEYIDPLTRMAPASHLLFGTDFPFFPMEIQSNALGRAEMSDELRRQISHENALALFPRVQEIWNA